MTAQQTDFRQLGDHLARVCTALDDLAFHLDVHIRFLADGTATRLDRALADVERSAVALAEADAARDQFIRSVMPQWVGRPLAELVAAADEPWHGLLDHQRRHMDELMATVADLGDQSARAARHAAKRNQEALHLVTGVPVSAATGFGSRLGTPRAMPLLVDRSA